MCKVSTVIATAGGRVALLERTLASLAECVLPSEYNGTLVIENGGKFDVEGVVRRAAPQLRCRYHYVESGNKSAALNEGLGLLGDELIFFSDDDVRFSPNVLVEYERAALSSEGMCIFGGPTGADYEVIPPSWLRSYLPDSAKGWEPPEGREMAEDLAFLGFNWAIHARHIRQFGGFDPEFGPGSATGSTGQEGEMQSRLRGAGFRSRYVPGAMVWHYVPAERCSPDWAVERAYRNGVSAGKRGNRGRIAPFGCPIWVFARIMKSAVRAGLGAASSNSALRFEAKLKQSYNRGLMRGFRQRRYIVSATASRN